MSGLNRFFYSSLVSFIFYEIFNNIIKQHDLSPKRTLFVDDKKDNTDIAEELGLHVWNLQVGEEDVVDLFSKKELPL